MYMYMFFPSYISSYYLTIWITIWPGGNHGQFLNIFMFYVFLSCFFIIYIFSFIIIISLFFPLLVVIAHAIAACECRGSHCCSWIV